MKIFSHYLYNNKEFYSLFALRQYIWETERRIFKSDISEEMLAEMGVECVYIEKAEETKVEKTEEQIAKEKLKDEKKFREIRVNDIRVIVDGMEFDGNEKSQERMSRMIAYMDAKELDDTATTSWVLSDDTVASVTKNQLKKALTLSTEQLNEIWLKPYSE